jgi:cytochrome b561
MNNNTKYTNVAIVLHWLIGIAILFMFVLGWFMTELPKETPKTTSFDIFNLGLITWGVEEEQSQRSFYFNLHKSVGLSLLMLIVLRMYWRFTHRPPAFLNSMKLWEKRLAKATHHSLYLLMFLIPLSGIIMSAGSKYGIKWFGIKIIPGFDDKAIRELFYEFHEIFGLLLLLILILHILGAVKHSIVDKDGTLRRMWFSK